MPFHAQVISDSAISFKYYSMLTHTEFRSQQARLKEVKKKKESYTKKNITMLVRSDPIVDDKVNVTT